MSQMQDGPAVFGTVKATDLKRLAKQMRAMMHEEGEFAIDIAPEGWHVSVSNVAYTMVARVRLAPDTPPTTTGRIGLHIGRLQNSLKAFPVTCAIQVGLDGGDLVLASENRTHRLRLIDPSNMSTQRFPEPPMTFHVTLDADQLLSSVKEQEPITSFILFSFTPAELRLDTHVGSSDTRVASAHLSIPCAGTGEPCSGVFPCDNLIATLEPHKGEPVRLSTGPKMPLLLQYDSGDDAIIGPVAVEGI